MAQEMKQLKIKRGMIKGAVTRFENYLNSLSDNNHFDIIILQNRLTNFRSLFNQFKDVQEQIELHEEGEDPQTSFEEFEQFENNYHLLISKAETIIRKNELHNSDSSSVSLQYSQTSKPFQSNQVRLPKIDMPKFSGSYEDWFNFYNTFKALIHTNSSLSKVQKLQYLISSLHGEAAGVLAAIDITEENYDCAWDSLCERYDNKRIIINKHIQCILDLPSMSRENATVLRQLVDGLNKHVRILKSLNRPVDSWDDLLIHVLSNKLDPTTIKEWESTLKRNVLPTLKEVTEFLSTKCNILETVARKGHITSSNNSPNNRQQSLPNNRQYKQLASNVVANKQECQYCNQDHGIQNCERFISFAIDKRIKEAKAKKLCLNCLRKGHFLSACKSSSCRKCKQRHNTLLHLDSATETRSVSNHAYPINQTNQVLLSTAIVDVRDATGQYRQCRALLDSGSQSCFITESFASILRLPVQAVSIPVAGIGQSYSKIKSLAKVTIKSRYNSFTRSINCLLLKYITERLPINSFNQGDVKIPKNIKLADPKFNISGGIDLLIGAELFYDLLCVGQIKIGKSQPILHKTQLGWIISGQLILNQQTTSSITCSLATSTDLDESLVKFWRLEEYSGLHCQSPDEKYCEDHFIKTFHRNESGRFVVKIPFKPGSLSTLGESKMQAIKRMHSLERKFEKNPILREEYSAFIHEYLSLGHMKLAPVETDKGEPQPSFYFPHHAVVKQTSLTTKLRVVFDGSARTTTGVSINSIQMIGPTLQQDLLSIVMRFRTHKYVMTADIAKMYRQIQVDKSQRCLQRILWRDNPAEEFKTYELCTVTYGTASASFLAVRSLHQLAIDELANYPTGSKLALRDFYVDDLLTGADSIEQAKKIQSEMSEMLLKGGFDLRKWVSNCPEIIHSISSDIDHATVSLDKDEDIKTLGLQWNAHGDTFKFSRPNYDNSTKITKRRILSNISKIFDPLGLIGPIIVNAKLIMQQLWQQKLTWDESVPISIHTHWLNFENQLRHLDGLRIPRWIIGFDNVTRIELHGFSDASEQAYGACIYVRAENSNNQYSTNLLCSKSRIAPLKNISLPKLELCGALLLARLMDRVMKTIDMPISDTYYWTDSTITLAWIKSTTRTWKTFVANRVGEIQDLTNPSHWYHVRTHDNPADIISRGSSPEALIGCQLWWNGPSWLLSNLAHQLIPNNISPDIELPECRITVSNISSRIEDCWLISKFSNFDKLIRVTAFCLRFVHNIKQKIKSVTINTGPLSIWELNNAAISIVKRIQANIFARELSDLQLNNTVNAKSKLLCLNPFIDSTGVIRVGGRLRKASLSFTMKHPIVLPKNHAYTRLVIEYEHKKNFHSGIQATLSSLRKSYWPLGGRDIVRDVVRKCVICFKVNPRSTQPIMGNLPEHRVTPSRPFSHVGVDYFGPLYIRDNNRRNSKVNKAYGAVFICMATKAVHLELATDLSTETFLGSMKRFMSRRGKPSDIHSDNGTNFIGADKELQKLREVLTCEASRNKIISTMAENKVNWHFIPARAPHFGGIWEAAVKSVKYHIRRIVGNGALTYEEMYTLLVQIEAILNSRPLTPLSNDPNDYSALTPGHFLIGDSLCSNAEPDLMQIAMNRLSRWQYIERLRQHFWIRWSKEYLTQLQVRNKWQTKEPSCTEVDRLVLIREDNAPPLKWPMGRIESTHPGEDGVIRAVTVRTSTGSFKRPVTRLCPLPIEI